MTVEQHTGQTARTGSNFLLFPTKIKRTLPGTLRPLKNNSAIGVHNQNPLCPLCGEPGGFNHAAAGCRVALHQGRYSWRHDTVLKLLGNKISKILETNSHTDWDIAIDHGLKFSTTLPSHIFGLTKLRPDLVITFPNDLRTTIIELTCPLPHNMGKWKELKAGKYSHFIALAAMHGWHADLFTVEVASHGLTSQGIPTVLHHISLRSDLQANKTALDCSALSQNCTEEIIIYANQQVWTTPLARRLSG